MTGTSGRRLADLFGARPTAGAMPPWVRAFHFVRLVGQHFRRDACAVRAAGMAYTSLLALVPALVVVFAFLAGFGTLRDLVDQAKGSLWAYVLPAASDEVSRYVDVFIENARAVNAVGLVGLLVTTILLFNAIEDAFNAVLHVSRERSFIAQVTTFTSFLIWGPVLIGASFILTGKLRGLLDAFPAAWVGRAVALLVPYVLTTAAMVLAFTVIPAARVRASAALLGGAVAGVGWELAKVGFAHYVARLVTYHKVYGSLSVVPIFLVWLYVTWLIVLVGLETAYVRENFEALLARDVPEPRGRERLRLGLRVFGEVARAHDAGHAPPDAGTLAAAIGVPVDMVSGLLSTLAARGMVVSAGGEGRGYVPGRSTDRIAARDLLAALLDEDRPFDAASDDLARRFDGVLADAEDAIRVRLGDLTTAAVVRGKAGERG